MRIAFVSTRLRPDRHLVVIICYEFHKIAEIAQRELSGGDGGEEAKRAPNGAVDNCQGQAVASPQHHMQLIPIYPRKCNPRSARLSRTNKAKSLFILFVSFLRVRFGWKSQCAAIKVARLWPFAAELVCQSTRFRMWSVWRSRCGFFRKTKKYK